MIGLAVLFLIALAAILVPYISPYTFNAVDAFHIQEGPSWKHPFGTAELGEDELTRVLLAGRVSLQVGFLVALFLWMPLTRIVRASALSLKEREFVQAARAMGASHRRIIFRHILPNSVAEITVFTTLTVGIAILTETALSFLGLGINSATQVSWGNMLSNQQANVLGGTAWWLTVFPGAFILVTVLCVNFIGDALRDALDPYGMAVTSHE
jgi:ABC-type dipeptide/oligopeptide/nickel transport system permease subunit